MATKKLRKWDGPTPLKTKTKAVIAARISAAHVTDDELKAARYGTDCKLLIDEVDRLEFELVIAHRLISDYKSKSKDKRRTDARKEDRSQGRAKRVP